MTGLGVLAVGLVLCFFGLRSIHLAVLASGFALGWLLAESLGGSLGVLLVVALAAAVAVWLVAVLVLKAALFVVGAIAGGVVGAKLFGLLEGGEGSWVLAAVFVVAVAALTGLATQRFHGPFLVWVTALAGAALAISGAARTFPDALDFLRFPSGTVQGALAVASWVALGVAGWTVQRRWTGDARQVEA